MRANDTFELIEIHRKDAPDAVFEGKLLGEIDNLEEAIVSVRRSSERWTVLALYELRDGNWVAVTLACSDKPGETDFGDCRLIAREEVGSQCVWHLGPNDMQRQAMAFRKWTWLAKNLADKLGWDVRQHLGPPLSGE